MCKDYVYNLQADLEAKENDIRQLKNELEKSKAAKQNIFITYYYDIFLMIAQLKFPSYMNNNGEAYLKVGPEKVGLGVKSVTRLK